MKRRIISLVLAIIMVIASMSFSFVVEAASNIVINGVDIGYAHNSYFTKNGSSCANSYWSNGRCHKNDVCESTAHSQCNCMRYWPTGKSSTCQIDLLASQCFGFARYCQWKVYGKHDGNSLSSFSNITGNISATNCTASNLKSKLLGCAPATHIRTGDGSHSISIVSTNDTGARVVDCNYNGYCIVRDKTYTWTELATYLKGKGGVKYAYAWGSSVPTPKPEQTVTFTKNTNYPTPISVYPAATSGKVTVYNSSLVAYDTNTAHIAYNDLCTINAVYTNGYCSVTYPISNGSRTEYAKLSSFVTNSVTPYSWTPSRNLTTYTRSNKATTFGSVFTTDSCKVVGKSGNLLQIIYPVSGGYKMGWVDTTTTTVTPDPAPESTVIPGPVASGIFNGKKIVVMAPNKISFGTNAYVSAYDICYISNVNESTGKCNITYPSGGTNVFASGVSTRTREISMTEVVSYNAGFQMQQVTAPSSLTVYPTSDMSAHGTNWTLDPGDVYYTVNKSGANTEVLYYCSRGAHAGYWKLGWVKLNYYYLDLNGNLDSNVAYDIAGYGTADVTINGNKLATNITDFYNSELPYGSTYEINNIKARSGYTYNGVYSGSAKGTITGNTTVVLKFTKNPPVLSDIVVTSKPTKTTYLEGESLNTSGLVVTARYNDGSTKNVTASCSFAGYSSTPGTKTVTATYSGKTTAFTVTVKSKSPTGITVTSLPSKTSYYVGEIVNFSGLVVKATYDNGTSATVTDYDIYADEGVTEFAGTVPISVTYAYNGVLKSTSFNITVVSPKLTLSKSSVSMTEGTSTTITATTVPSSQTVTWTSTNTSVATVSGGKITAVSSGSASVKATFSYMGYTYTASCVVTVVSKTLTSVSVNTMPTKTKYYEGDNLDTTGLVLTATYNNGTTESVGNGYTCSPTTLSSAGTQMVTVTYGGKTATFNVTVTAKALANISVKTMPTKTKYYVGDGLDTTGLVLTATYNNGTTALINSGYTCNPTVLNSAGTQIVTITYEGKTTVYEVNVTEKINYTPTVSVLSKGNITAGETFDVKVDLSNNKGIASLKLKVAYDTSLMSLVNVSYNDAMGGSSQEPQKLTSPVTLNWYNGAANYVGDCTFATLTFKANADIKEEKTGSIEITYDEEDVYNIDETNIPLIVKNGTISISPVVIQSASKLIVDNVTAKSGETITIPVTINENPGLAGFKFRFTYDTSVLTPVSVTKGSILTTGTLTSNLDQGGDLSNLNYISAFWSNPANVTASGEILNVTFTVNADTKDGTYPIVASYEEGDVTNQDYDDVILSVVNGSVNVVNYMIGDVYADSKINTKDSVRLGQYLADWEIELSEYERKSADIHVDNKINTKDSVKLGQYLADWDVELMNLFGVEYGNISFEAGKVSAVDGYVDIPVTITENSGVAGFKLKLNYDKTLLTPVTITKSSALMVGTMTSNLDQGGDLSNLKAVSVFWSNPSNVTSIGDAFTVRFKVSDNVTESIPVTLSYEEGDICDQNYNDLQVKLTDGAVIAPEAPVTGNISFEAGKVSAVDGYVDIPVTITENSGVAGFKLKLNYDKALLTPVTITKSSALMVGTMTSNLDQGGDLSNLKAVSVFWSNPSNVMSIGEAFIVKFKVSDNATENIPVTLSYEEGDICDQYYNDLKVTLNDGSVIMAKKVTVTLDGTKVETNGKIGLGNKNADGTYSLPENVTGYYIETETDKSFVDAGEYVVAGGEVITTSGINVELLNGAQVRYGGGLDENGRISEGNGLRFIATVDRSNVDEAVITGYGMKITAEDSDKEAVVDAVNWQDAETFTVAITNFSKNNYNRNYTAVPFVKVKYSDGTEKTVYGTEEITRSVYYVATGLLKTGAVDENYGVGTSYGLYDVLNAYVNMVGVRLSMDDNGNVTVRNDGDGAYKGEAFFDVESTLNEDGTYTITVTPVSENFEHPVKIMEYWDEYVRINNNHSLVYPNIFDVVHNENGGVTFRFTKPE